MKLNRMRRFGVLGAVVASVLGALLVSAPSSASTAGWHCQTIVNQLVVELERCITIKYNQEYGTYRAKSVIIDHTGSRDYTVWVNDVKLLHATATPGVYETVRVNPDRDGSFDVQDAADTSTVNPCNWNDPTFTVEATFYWRGAASGHTTYRADSVWIADC